TADELLAMPPRDAHGNDCRLALIRGEVKTMSPTGLTHGILCANIATELSIFVRRNRLGIICGAETGFLVERDPDTVVGADVAFISRKHLEGVENREKFVPFAPDLAVEVLSPSNTVNEMDEKVALYFAAGSRLVWIVNPKRRTVAVYRSAVEARILGEQETLDGGEVLPGFSYKLSDLFAEE
ncbi:MAG TPA: Uma2 family endonuclease, partial [Pyrinomonadaceae bacterium]|nr:Uma2 family endonuclease [Pyrinomonadaceae bacterium]